MEKQHKVQCYAAPLEGITGYIYRNAHQHIFQGVDKYFTPFVTPKPKKGLNTREKNDIAPEHNKNIPVVPQILTNKAADFIKVAGMMEELGYKEVNLNLGCPSGTVVSKKKGSGFLADLEGMKYFFDEVFSQVNIEVSVKTRLGVENPDEVIDLMNIYNAFPISEVIVHARVREDYYKRPVNQEAFAQCLAISKHPVCYNGDLFTAQDIENLTAKFPDIKAVMLGRGMIANPQLTEVFCGREAHGDSTSVENRQDGIYEVEKNDDGDLEVTAPYQTKRIIVENDNVEDTYGASHVYVNKADGETILQYDAEEDTESAFEALKQTYGPSQCYLDKVVSLDETAMGLPLSQEIVDGVDSYSWGNDYMGMSKLKKEAASYGYTRKVTVAIVDTGINTSNRMFKGRTISSQSYNFFNGNKNVTDVFGHGTHVSGIIVDATPANVSLLVLRVANSKGQSSMLTIKTALQYAVAKKSDVINLSMGFIDANADLYNYLDSTIDKAYEKEIPISCAAGNQETGGIDVRYCYPANYSKTIAVSAIDSSGRLANYSNRGNGIDFAAPGTGIISADYKGSLTLRAMSGTSMAAPHITAAIAYLKMMQPNLSVKGVCRELELYCRNLGAKKYYGRGCPILTNLFKKGITNKKYIVILKPMLSSVSNKGSGIKVTWKKATGAASYYVYRRTNNGAWKRRAVLSASSNSYIDRNVKQGKKYTYKVRAYNNGIFGRFSSEKKVYRLKTLTNIRVKNTSGRRAAVLWKKKTYATTYQVKYAANPSFNKARKVSANKKNSRLTTKKLKKKTYYFQIRYSYKKGGVKSWSAWSKVKKIKIR